MQFAAVLLIAATASAVAIERGNDCNSIAICNAGTPKSYCSKPSECSAKGGDPSCCITSGLVNVLTCTSILSGNTVNVSLLDGLNLGGIL